MGSRSLLYSVRKHVRFSVRELEELLTIALIFGFVLSFRDWGVDQFDYVAGAVNLLWAVLAVFGALVVALAVQKVFAAAKGLVVEHVVWTGGLIASLVIGLFTNGVALVFLSSSFTLSRVVRVGRAKGVGLNDLAQVAGAGLAAHIVLAGVASVLVQAWPVYVLQKMVLFNLAYVAYNVLPLPKIAGSRIFLASRVWYAFAFFAVIGFVLLGVAGLPSFILALAVGAIAAVVFFFKYENEWA